MKIFTLIPALFISTLAFSKPVCLQLEDGREGWGIEGTDIFKEDICLRSTKKAVCHNQGTRSEGWYISSFDTNFELIAYANCAFDELKELVKLNSIELMMAFGERISRSDVVTLVDVVQQGDAYVARFEISHFFTGLVRKEVQITIDANGDLL